MNLLLDTHVLLWWLDDSPNLSKIARSAIADGNNLVFVSAAVIWEIRIKSAIGKLEIPKDFMSTLRRQSFEMLSINIDHAYAVGDLPDLHRDPFDRILIAQARLEGFTLVTRDAYLKRYRIPIIKA